MAKKSPGDQPTALIAPSDYQHIFKGDLKNLLNDVQKSKKNRLEKDDAIVKVYSDQPTALIAPSDYEHIFKGESKGRQSMAIRKITSDTPTALIAPSDFQHIYCDPTVVKEVKKNKFEAARTTARQISKQNTTAIRQGYQQDVLPPSVQEVVQRFINKQKKEYTIKQIRK